MQTVIPRSPYDADPMLTALCVWREARGCDYQAKLGVVWVIRNRCAASPREGFRATPTEEILRRWQFSSFNEGDPNSLKYPDGVNSVWQDCLRAATDAVSPDPTGGAVWYFSWPLTEPPSAWGHVEITATIDGLTFCGFPRAVSV